MLSGIRQRPETSVHHDKSLYRRELLAVNGSIVSDKQLLAGRETEAVRFSVMHYGVHSNKWHDSAVRGIKALLSKGTVLGEGEHRQAS
jgi:hypothetical protein